MRKAEARGKLLVQQEQISPVVAAATGLVILLFLVGFAYQAVGILGLL